MNKSILISDPLFKKHLTGPFHPESPLRMQAVLEGAKGLHIPIVQPRKATEEEILFCHTKEYLDIVKKDVAQSNSSGIIDGSFTLSTGDVQICPSSYEVALYAAGGVLTAIDQIMEEKSQTAFCAIRPPGHHATPNQGMGFCLFNNVAIGACYLKQKYHLSKILIVDWDLHHGNGTEEIFREDPSVLYFSTHELGNFPGTGLEQENNAHILNCSIRGGKNSRLEVLKAFEEKLCLQAESFQPQFILISCGFDGHYLDSLGNFDLMEEDFRTLTQIVQGIAQKSAKGRIVSVLEGGYDLQAIADSTRCHLEALVSN